jgi:cytochrome c-type biogenesis protein CcmE
VAVTFLPNAKRPPSGSPRRRKVRWSFVVAGLAIAGAVLYLVLANTGATAEYYMTISQLRACSNCSARTVRVAGVVVAGSIVRNEATQVVDFRISDAKTTAAMPVTYSGVVPDIFAAGTQVVVEGKLAGDGVFQADSLLTKCPSKFQAATPVPSGQ